MASLLSLVIGSFCVSLGAVEMSEVHFQPGAAHPGAEFVELFNPAENAVDLAGWKLEKGVRLTFPQGTSIPPRGWIVVCGDRAAFAKTFGDRVAVVGVFDGRLDNAGEALRLVDAAGRAVTDLRYAPGAPWPSEPAGEGSSLSRIDFARDADDPAAWCAAPPTPGAANAIPELARARKGLSLYAPRVRPETPKPGEPIEVSVRVYGGGGVKPGNLILHYDIGGRARTIAMKAVEGKSAASGDPRWSATIPGQEDQSILRWRIEAQSGDGLSRFPDARSKPREPAIYVRPPVATQLPLYELVMQPTHAQSLSDDPYSNELRPATLIYKGRVFEGVGVRCRGAWARTWPKKALKIVLPGGQRIGKRTRLNLNSGWRDPALVRELLAYEIYRDAGSPSLEARVARLEMNGALFGLFIEVEQPRKRALRRAGIAGADLLKAFSRSNAADERAFTLVAQYAQHYSLESGSQKAFEALHRFCSGLQGARDRGQFLAETLDLDRAIAYVAAGVLTQNWDSYNKNHLVARRPDGKWCMMPWDLDRTLGDHWSFGFEEFQLPVHLGTSALPGPTGWNRILDALFADAVLKKRLEAKLAELLKTTFTEERLGARIDALRRELSTEAALDRQKWGGAGDLETGMEELKQWIARRRGFLLGELPGGEPDAPQVVSPSPETPAGAQVVLRSSPYQHADPSVTHKATRFWMRDRKSSPGSALLDETVEGRLELQVPVGLLEPRTAYGVRIAHVASNGKTSPWSDEAGFTTKEFPFQAVAVDLSKFFNTDLVANPGDMRIDSVDAGGGRYVVAGYDGQRAKSPTVRGLPTDGVVGIHRLAPYDGRNALQIQSGDTDPRRVTAPKGRYCMLRLLVAGGGDVTLPLAIEYADGTRVEASIPCDDWYDDNPPDGAALSVRSAAAPALDGLDRIRRGAFRERHDPALFEVRIALDDTKELVALTLEPARAEFAQGPQGRFNLFAATLVSFP